MIQYLHYLSILIATRALLADPKKWTKGAAARDANGKRVIFPSSPQAVCWCLGGALIKEARQYALSRWEIHYLLAILLRNMPREFNGIENFNDAPGTTHKQLLQALDAAIDSLQKRNG